MANLIDEIMAGAAQANPYAGIQQLGLRDLGMTQGIVGFNGDNEIFGDVHAGWTADFDALRSAGFQSKYNSVSPLGDDLFQVVLQAPGGHKYDTLDAIYKRDPVTGQATLQGDPTPSRQTSSRDKMQDFAEKAGLVVGSVLGAGYLGSLAAGTGAGGMTAAQAAAMSPEMYGLAAQTGLGGTSSLAGAAGAGTFGISAPAYGAGLTAEAATGLTAPFAAGGGGASLVAPGAAGGLGGLGGLGAAAGGGGGSWFDTLGKTLASGSFKDYGNILSGLYGMKTARDVAKSSDPFAPHRPGYAQKLQDLEANPSAITRTPGFLAGIEAIDRSSAASGQFGGGNQAVALSRYGGDFYQNELARLATLAGAGQVPGAGQVSAANLTGQGLAAIGYGLGGFKWGG